MVSISCFSCFYIRCRIFVSLFTWSFVFTHHQNYVGDFLLFFIRYTFEKCPSSDWYLSPTFLYFVLITGCIMTGEKFHYYIFLCSIFFYYFHSTTATMQLLLSFTGHIEMILLHLFLFHKYYSVIRTRGIFLPCMLTRSANINHLDFVL